MQPEWVIGEPLAMQTSDFIGIKLRYHHADNLIIILPDY